VLFETTMRVEDGRRSYCRRSSPRIMRGEEIAHMVIGMSAARIC
jgi:hypothetical protein